MKPLRNFIKLSGINQRSWLNPLFLALLPTILVIWLQPIKFNSLLFESSFKENNVTIWFNDHENDGKAEKYQYGNEDSEGHAYIKYYNDRGQYINQYNFKFPIAKCRILRQPYSADFNMDGVKDVVFFSQKQDSLFLDAFDYKNEIGFAESRFITQIGGLNKYSDFHVNHIGHYDSNNDSVPEFYFSVASGFALYPRRVFRYDFANDSLITSINTGAGYLSGEILTQNDSMMVIVGSSASGNTRDNYPFPYHDTTTWLFNFDKNLKLKTKAKNYGRNPGGIELPLQIDEYIYYNFASNNDQPENKLLKMNWKGEILDSIEFDFYVSKRFYSITNGKSRRYLIMNHDSRDLYEFNHTKFEVEKFKKLKGGGKLQIMDNLDLNKNGKSELLVYDSLTKQLIFLNSRFKELNRVPLDFSVKFITANYYSEKKYGELALSGNNQTHIFRYYNNPYQYLKYPIWLVIYLLSTLFVAIILFFQNRRTQHQQKMEQQLADLQLQNLRNQLDPHFTFNVLNSVGNAIYKQDKEGAYDLFQRFTRIIRSSLMSSDKVFRSLKEELQFTQDYLEFQQLRFKDRFNYSIKVGKNIETQFIRFPKMLIQGFAENAVKHAFYGVDYVGQISINVVKEKSTLKVIIEDDGIGINKSKELKTTSGTQKGLGILNEQVEQINRIYNTSYLVLIENKNEKNFKLNGTRVVISF